MQVSCVASGLAAALLLHGCAPPWSHGGTESDLPTSGPSTTATTTREPSTNIWQFRNDEDMGPQTSFDMSLENDKSLYGACWKSDYDDADDIEGLETLASGQWINYGPMQDQFIEDGVEEDHVVNKTYGTYDGKVGVTLFNKRNSSNKAGCIMRHSRVPVDLSVIGRMELDITTRGSSEDAPWYSVWLAPMLYSGEDDATKAAEIDIIENYDYTRRGLDMSVVKTTFAQCGQPGEYSWTEPICKAMQWNEPAGRISAHITLKALTEDGMRVLRVHRCSQPATQCDDSSEYAEIKVDSDPPTPDIKRNEWFPVWNKDIAKEWYGHYWLMADIWWTSGTDFELSVGNVSFFFDNDTAWEMPLDGPVPSTMSRESTTAAPGPDDTTAAPGSDETTAAPGPDGTTATPGPDGTTAAPGPDGNCCGDEPLDCCGSAEGCCPASATEPMWCCMQASAEMV